MLIEIHVLQNHAPSNLNRDDTGSPKECVFGGYKRARISSQCLKRSIRRSKIFESMIGETLASRTRRLPELVRERLKQAGVAEPMAEIAAKKAAEFGKKEKKEAEGDAAGNKEKAAEAPTDYATRQTMFLTEADIAAVTQVLQKLQKTPKLRRHLRSSPRMISKSERRKRAIVP